LLGLGLGTAITSAQPAIGHARWCVTMSLGGMLQCNYRSLEECMFYARGVSNQCSLNPWYDGPPDPPRKRRPRASNH
jgi:hypothetical protein